MPVCLTSFGGLPALGELARVRYWCDSTETQIRNTAMYTADCRNQEELTFSRSEGCSVAAAVLRRDIGVRCAEMG